MTQPDSRLGDLINLNIFQNIHDAVMIFNSDYRIIAVNPGFEQLTGYMTHEVVGHSPQLLQPDERKDVYLHQVQQWVEQQGSWNGVLWQRHKHGALFASHYFVQEVRDVNSTACCYVAIISTPEGLPLLYDALTGLANSDLLLDLLRRMIAHLARDNFDRLRYKGGDTNTHTAVAMIDMQRLNVINQQFGFTVGDQLLLLVAYRINHHLRDTDVVGRWHNGHFAILLPDFEHLDSLRQFFVRLLAELKNEYAIDEHCIKPDFLIGVSVSPDDALDAQLLFSQAELAVDALKRQLSSTNIQFYGDLSKRHDAV